MPIERWLVLGALLGLAGCSSPTEPDARVGAAPAQDDRKDVGVIHPCGQRLGELYRICSGKK